MAQYPVNEIPGFDAATGKAVSFHISEWRVKCHRLRLEFRYDTDSINAYDGSTLVYEIYAEPNHLQYLQSA